MGVRDPPLGGPMTELRTVVPVCSSGEEQRLVGLVTALDREYELSLTVVNPVADDESVHPDAERTASQAAFRLRSQLSDRASVDNVVSQGGSLAAAIGQTVESVGASVMLLAGPRSGESVPYDPVGVAEAASCDAVFAAGVGRVESPDSVLVPVADGPHSRLTVSVADVVAGDGARYTLLHVVDDDADAADVEEWEARLDELAGAIEGTVEVSVERAATPTAAVVDRTDGFDATVIGGPTETRLRHFLFGSDTETIQTDATTPVLTAWRGERPSLLIRQE